MTDRANSNIPKARKPPKTKNPILLRTLKLIDDSGETLINLGKRTGVSKMTMVYWRQGGNAQLASVQAVLNALGYRLVIEKIHKTEDDI